MSNVLMTKPEFDWTGELEKTVVNSLVTTFGLDFLLFEDKRGGDVDTINNVRQGIYATDEAKNAYDSRGDYDGSIYRTHEDYKEKGRKDKKAIENGELYDAYNKNNKLNRKREIDHTISAKEIHDDAGRVLANVDGVKIANRDYNLNTTTWDVNNPKREHSVTKFINEIAPQKIKQLEKTIEHKKNQISKITGDTPEERHKREKLSKEIETHENQKKELESILENKEDILAADKKAREEYNKEINWKYYTSSKFFKSTALAAGRAGLKMGTRQALGLVLAEIWFELRERIPEIYQSLKQNFTIIKFLEKIAKTLSNIFERVKERTLSQILCKHPFQLN
ncbi:DNA repair protein, partial [Glaesserella parasuis]|nr:DNA repair protein [Glaesserella parasuis]